ncbi:restriction endonuclease subunit S [Kitasatospora sp. NPDC087271]|uniref:restriction endonuclease subunit S n=1 Tax=Kitasatospora sp. NPDC087271 TaxID=3364067 RepID=UPI003822739A
MTSDLIAPWLSESRWPTVPIRFVARLGTGHTPSRTVPAYWETCTIPWITLADVWQLRSGAVNVILETKEKISYLGLANSAAVRHRAGTVILSRTASVGFSAIMGTDMATTQDFVTWTCGPDLEPRFLLHALRAMSPDLKRVAAGSTHKTIYMPDIEQLRVPLPPVDEQRRIADFLDSETAYLDKLRDLRQSQLNKLDEWYRAEISEATTPGISSPGGRNSLWPWLPASISTIGLGYLARVQSGVAVHGARKATPNDAEYPYLRVANVQGEKVDLAEIKTITISADLARRATLRAGDVVMTEANGNPDNLGRGAVWNGEIPRMVHQNHIFAIRVDRRKLIPAYLSALLASNHGRRYFRFTSSQVGIATTSSTKVMSFPVPKIGLAEQQAVVDRCEGARSTTTTAEDALTRQLSLLAEHRQALITAAVTGQFDVTSARKAVVV